MTNAKDLPCDGCGQPATPEHITRRLQRLEWTTRYRPIHINTLFLGAFSPLTSEEFLYSPGGESRGEAAVLLEIAGGSLSGKNVEDLHLEFQRIGYFLTHVLECPLEEGSSAPASLLARVPATVARIRRSLKPKRVVPISGLLGALEREISAGQLGCPVILDGNVPFALGGPDAEQVIPRLREALGPQAMTR
jgi:hypothetical protein